MATTEVNICNLALARIGRSPVITSLRPPDNSQEAQACGQFYDIEMANIVNSHDWGFSTVQQGVLAAVTNPSSLWAYAYALPSNFMQMIALFNSSAAGDVMVDWNAITTFPFYPISNTDPIWQATTTQEQYTVESGSNGNLVLYTDEPSPLIKYQAYPNISSALPPLFIDAFTWKLAAGLAGALIRDDVGVAAAKQCLQAYQSVLSQAKSNDCNNRNINATFTPSGIRARL